MEKSHPRKLEKDNCSRRGVWGGTRRTQGLKGVAKQITALGHLFHWGTTRCSLPAEGRVRPNPLWPSLLKRRHWRHGTDPTKRLTNPYVPSLTLHEASSPARAWENECRLDHHVGLNGVTWFRNGVFCRGNWLRWGLTGLGWPPMQLESW